MPRTGKRPPTPGTPSTPGSQQGRRVKFRAGTDSQIEINSQDGSVSGDNHITLDSGSDVDEGMGSVRESLRLLSLQSSQQRIAASFYDQSTTILSILEDSDDSKAFDLAKNLMDQLEPTFIIANTKSSEDLLQAVHDYCDEHEDCSYQIRPHKEFWQNQALSHLSHLRIQSPPNIDPYQRSPTHSDSEVETETSARLQGHPMDNAMEDIDSRIEIEEHRMKMNLVTLGCFTDVNAVLAIGTSGALVAQLQRHGMLLDGGMDGHFRVRSIHHINLQEYMFINADSLRALSIFDEEDHASMHSQRRKEGLTLFGIMNTCSTKAGTALLRQWFQRPLLSLHAIKARHDAVAVYSRVDNHAIADELKHKMKRIKNVQGLLMMIKAGGTTWRVWKSLADFILTALDIRSLTSQLNSWEAAEINQKVLAVINPDTVGEISSRIVGTIDWDASQAEDMVMIRPGVDEELDDAQEKQMLLPETLTTAAQHVEQEDAPGDIFHKLSVVSFPQMGYFIVGKPKRLDMGLEDLQILIPDNWTFAFNSEELLYFKSDKMEDMDETMGDLQGLVMDRSIEIVAGLTEQVRDAEMAILAVADICSEVDCLTTLATTSRRSGLSRPKMVAENVIAIQDGWHPLHQEMEANYVPNDTYLAATESDTSTMSESTGSAGGGRIMMITGANGSGKSAYSKQVALIVFLAQVGCFVPARAATLGACDKIFTRLHTTESISRPASSFMIDLSQVSLALRGATARSLIVLDEFGKGTNPQDGTSLLTGVLQHLINRGSSCPHVIAITHFHELFARNLLEQGDGIGFYEMRAMPSQDSELIFLYKLTRSTAVTSYAFECALQHEVPAETVERARLVSEKIAIHDVATLVDEMMIDDEDTRKIAVAEELTRRFLRWELDDNSDDDVFEVMNKMIAEVEREVDQDVGGSESDEDEEEDELATSDEQNKTGNDADN